MTAKDVQNAGMYLQHRNLQVPKSTKSDLFGRRDKSGLKLSKIGLKKELSQLCFMRKSNESSRFFSLSKDKIYEIRIFPVSVSLLILILLGAFSIRFLGADSREQTRRPLGAHQSIWQ
jgi:hypothetical protein